MPIPPARARTGNVSAACRARTSTARAFAARPRCGAAAIHHPLADASTMSVAQQRAQKREDHPTSHYSADVTEHDADVPKHDLSQTLVLNA